MSKFVLTIEDEADNSIKFWANYTEVKADGVLTPAEKVGMDLLKLLTMLEGDEDGTDEQVVGIPPHERHDTGEEVL